MQHDSISSDKKRGHFWRVCALYAVFAAFGLFLLTEHRTHIIGLLPFLLLAACPLMHLFMHHHHHRHVLADSRLPEPERDTTGGTKQGSVGQR